MQLDHEQSYIFTIKGVLSTAECEKMMQRIERGNLEPATINTVHGARVHPNVRNNERIIFDDLELAIELLDRVKDRVPQKIHHMKLAGVNERFRCYRYKTGMRFAPHADGAFHRNEDEQSWYTFMIYLNEGFVGGNTIFLVEPEVSITPETGMALFFQHPIIHEGSIVESGVKYVLRTDLMYRKDYF